MNAAEHEIIELMKRGEISNDDGLKALYELQHKEADPNDPPANEDQPAIKTTKVAPFGDTYHHDPKKPAMLPVPQQIMLSRFTVPRKDPKTGRKELRPYMSEREFKLLFFLLHAVWDELEPGAEHQVCVHDMWSAMKHEYGGTTNTTTWMWDSAANLVGTTVEWTETHGDERFKAIASLLTYAMTHEEDRKTGILKFKFNDKLIPILKEPSRFTKLKLHFLMNLSSRHAIILYGILEGYANHKYINVFTFELDLIRSWLNIEPQQYKYFKDFRVRVLDHAFKQINKNKEGAGFSISWKPIKQGRKIHAIEITINKTKDRLKLETEIQERNKKRLQQANTEETYIKPLDYEFLQNILKNMIRKRGKDPKNFDINALIGQYETEWRKSVYDSGECETMKSPEGCFAGFIINKEIEAATSLDLPL